MCGCPPHRLALTALLWIAATLSMAGRGVPPASLPAGEDDTAGAERLYLKGLSLSGAPVSALVQGDVRVTSAAMPCSNCHRRSGWGTSEGPLTVPPVVGSVLFKPLTRGAVQMTQRTQGHGTRPAYTVESLRRALRDGVDPAGRTLAATMPRYDFGDRDVSALAEYLGLLGRDTPPGVTASKLHFATVIAGEVPAERRESMLTALRGYVQRLNVETRHETRRRERGPWDMAQEYENYREWVVHEWTLTGDPAGWAERLEELYRQQPVYALLGGLAEDTWEPVEAFSARHRIPVVLPQVPLPPVNSIDPFYSMYFSRGVALEARTLAEHFRSAGVRRVLQVSRCGTSGASAAALLAAAAGSVVRSECLAPGVGIDLARWRALLAGKPQALALWLGRSDRAALDALAAGDTGLNGVADVYLSSSLLGQEALSLPAPLRERASLLHPFVAPDEFERHAWRSLTWMKANRVMAADQTVAVNALFAAMLAADATSIPRVISSREYFIERLEHMAARTPSRSAYPAISFDAFRRFGSAGCYVLKMPALPGGTFRKVQQWFVPDFQETGAGSASEPPSRSSQPSAEAPS